VSLPYPNWVGRGFAKRNPAEKTTGNDRPSFDLPGKIEGMDAALREREKETKRSGGGEKAPHSQPGKEGGFKESSRMPGSRMGRKRERGRTLKIEGER